VTGKTYERTYYVNVTTKTSTSISELAGDSASEIAATTYYTVSGVTLGTQRPTDAGVYIQVVRYTSGKTVSNKVLVK